LVEDGEDGIGGKDDHNGEFLMWNAECGMLNAGLCSFSIQLSAVSNQLGRTEADS